MAIKRHKPLSTGSCPSVPLVPEVSLDSGWTSNPTGEIVKSEIQLSTSIAKPTNRTQLNILINELHQQGSAILSNGSANIQTEAEATLAASLGSASRRIRKFVSELLDPGIAADKKKWEDSKKDKAQCISPLDQLESALSVALGAYNTRLALAAAEQKRLQEESVSSRVEQSVVDEATVLIDAGRIDEAESLVAAVPSMIQEVVSSLPQTSKPIPKLSGSVGRDSYTYTLLDINKVNREVLISALTRTAAGRSALESTIKKLLDEHGESAVELVGKGSIEIELVNKVHFRA